MNLNVDIAFKPEEKVYFLHQNTRPVFEHTKCDVCAGAKRITVSGEEKDCPVCDGTGKNKRAISRQQYDYDIKETRIYAAVATLYSDEFHVQYEVYCEGYVDHYDYPERLKFNKDELFRTQEEASLAIERLMEEHLIAYNKWAQEKNIMEQVFEGE
jgi:uncharacterized pyridoxamine 5'-phosphate oxidase family protein